ncbi:MAG: hypothetical protein RLZZ540_553 [Bacteroidota bacterium]|jgi:hypothetical protein
MKKNITRYAKLFLALTFAVITTSCSDFLDEELTNKRNTDYYKTEEGVLSLAVGTYKQVLTTPYGTEMMFSHCNSGTDEFHVGGDASNGLWNSYDGGLRSEVTINSTNTIKANILWDNLYTGIGQANLLIESATSIESTNAAIKNRALGEGYFFRAYNYLRLVSQFGGVPLKLNSSTTVELEYTRATAQEVFTQIIDDFTQAYNLLDNTGAPARVTKDAAAHFLAKAYLARASEINDTWNSSTKTTDLQKVVTLSDEVISHHVLAANFRDLWNYIRPDGPNEFLPEIILSAQFTSSTSTSTAGNWQHLYFGSRYDIDFPQMIRDVTGGRGFSRLAATYYTYGVFDQVKDSRFWKSFRTEYSINNPGSGYVSGDLGVMYIINQPTDTRFPKIRNNNTITYSKTGKIIPTVLAAYSLESATSGRNLMNDRNFPPLNKYLDGSRISVASERGLRDVIVARSAETNLMAAEAKVRLASLGIGSYSDALVYINRVRDRATFKSGEVRSAYTDGGAAYPSSALNQNVNLNAFRTENSYFESNNIPETTTATSLTISSISSLPDPDLAIINTLHYTSDYDKMLCLVLNERSRELVGEFVRWEDLSRTKTLVKRAIAYNPEAAPNIKDFHLLRPIPQTFLDGILINGRRLTADEKAAMQNDGYK